MFSSLFNNLILILCLHRGANDRSKVYSDCKRYKSLSSAAMPYSVGSMVDVMDAKGA